MSSYIFKAKNKETGDVKVVSAIDDYFGSHCYGYFIENNVALTDEQFNQYWERIEVTPQKETPTPKTVEEDWRDKYKGMEQSWMHLKDQYAEVARALGFKGDSWFGDPLADHSEIVSRARTLTAQNQAADERLREVIEEVIETIESVKLTATKKHKDDTTPEKAKVVNEWLMPEVKRNIVEAVKTIAAKHGITNL